MALSSGSAEAQCHAPASAHKHWEPFRKLVEIVDKQLALSRTEFERRHARIRHEIRRMAGSPEAQHGP